MIISQKKAHTGNEIRNLRLQKVFQTLLIFTNTRDDGNMLIVDDKFLAATFGDSIYHFGKKNCPPFINFDKRLPRFEFL